jgi:hypothetical protein
MRYDTKIYDLELFETIRYDTKICVSDTLNAL